MLNVGITNTMSRIVTEDMTARKAGSGELDVLATPAVIALVEETAWRAVSQYLEDGMGTVGTLINIQHTAPTPVGKTVTCTVKLTEIDRRRLVFDITAADDCGEIACGIHERFIVDNEKFQAKANSK